MKTLTCILVSIALLSACGGRVNDDHPPHLKPGYILANGHQVLRDCPEAGTYYGTDETGTLLFECLTNDEMKAESKRKAMEMALHDAGVGD